MPLRLLVIDGADKGRSHVLPQAGPVLVGNSHRHADIHLNDLYVARLHCQLEVDGERVLVVAKDTPGGTLINGTKIKEQELRVGDVLRVGNSHLRLEPTTDAAPAASPRAAAAQTSAKPAGLPHLPAEKLEQLTGHTLGHFAIGAVLGRGHHGVVFRAHDTKTDQDVALRVLPPDFPAHSQELQRFISALKSMPSYRHPNLVALHGAGKTGPYCWMALELVEGESLVAVIERLVLKTKIKWKRALRVAIDLARALEFMHRHRLVHGHISPRNILIRSKDETAKLNDLMFGKALEGSQLRQSIPKKFEDELPFQSPEQTQPGAFVDDLSDEYSVGAVIYALLTGRPPLVGNTPEKTVQLIREVMPRKPAELHSAAPPEFQATVLKMLAKHQEDRFPTPSDLLANLERFAEA